MAGSHSLALLWSGWGLSVPSLSGCEKVSFPLFRGGVCRFLFVSSGMLGGFPFSLFWVVVVGFPFSFWCGGRPFPCLPTRWWTESASLPLFRGNGRLFSSLLLGWWKPSSAATSGLGGSALLLGWRETFPLLYFTLVERPFPARTSAWWGGLLHTVRLGSGGFPLRGVPEPLRSALSWLETSH